MSGDGIISSRHSRRTRWSTSTGSRAESALLPQPDRNAGARMPTRLVMVTLVGPDSRCR